MTELEQHFQRPLGIFNWVLSKDPQECAQRAVELGFSCIQWGLDLESEVPALEQAEAASAAFKEYELKVVALAGYQNLIAHDPAYKAKALSILEHYIAISALFPDSQGIATETGTKNRLSQWEGHPENLLPESWAELIQELKPIGEKAKAAGTRILIEGYVENVVRTAADLDRLKAELDMEAFGFVMDPFNLILEEKLPELEQECRQIFAVMQGHVGIAHAKDLLYTDGVVSTPRSGTGMFDMPMYFQLLDEQLPAVPLILEHLGLDEVEDTLNFLKRSYSAEVAS